MLFCKPLRNKSRYKPFRQIDKTFSFSEFEKASLLNKKDWDEVVGEKTIFFNTEYLRLIERSTHVDLKCRYIILYKNEKPCGIIYFQLTDFKANVFGDLLHGEINEIKSNRMKLFEKYVEAQKEEEVLFRMLMCGNNLISGEYGFLKSDNVSHSDFYKLLCTLIKTISAEENLRGKISAILIKDFYEPVKEIEKSDSFKVESFSVEPNLVVEIPKEVKTLNDYLQLFSKKYRNRAKAILKNRENFKIKILSEEEIEKNKKQLFLLYENIYSRAKFKLLQLPSDYFSEVKKIFKERFCIKGFYVNDELVAFSSGFLMPDNSIEAHYIGLNYKSNEELELYQNILYDFVETAITNGNSEVNLGRTAAEIKTTIGAKANELICYIQPQNTVSRLIVKPFIEFLKPKDWIPRNPFKEEVSAV
jgi:hypothetical protein